MSICPFARWPICPFIVYLLILLIECLLPILVLTYHPIYAHSFLYPSSHHLPYTWSTDGAHEYVHTQPKPSSSSLQCTKYSVCIQSRRNQSTAHLYTIPNSNSNSNSISISGSSTNTVVNTITFETPRMSSRRVLRVLHVLHILHVLHVLHVSLVFRTQSLPRPLLRTPTCSVNRLIEWLCVGSASTTDMRGTSIRGWSVAVVGARDRIGEYLSSTDTSKYCTCQALYL